MSSVECLREFVNERLTAAAEEIFGVFKRTIVEYEQELDRQRRLLDIVWKPDIKLHRIELPQHNVCRKEVVLTDQQLCNQVRDSSLDQEDPEPPQIKEEQEELCSSQEGEQLVIKQETDNFMLTTADEDSDHSEADLKINHQLLFNNSHVNESQNSDGGNQGYSGSMRNEEPKEILHKSRIHNDYLYNPKLPEIHCKTHTGQNDFQCDTCGKAFRYKSKLQRHQSIHTGEKPFYCKICGKYFRLIELLTLHTRRVHTVEKQHICKTCGKTFFRLGDLKVHIRTHTGERPFICRTCGKDFRYRSHFIIHKRTHTGEKLFACRICGNRFNDRSNLSRHIRGHRSEEPYSCLLVGKISDFVVTSQPT